MNGELDRPTFDGADAPVAPASKLREPTAMDREIIVSEIEETRPFNRFARELPGRIERVKDAVASVGFLASKNLRIRR